MQLKNTSIYHLRELLKMKHFPYLVYIYIYIRWLIKCQFSSLPPNTLSSSSSGTCILQSSHSTPHLAHTKVEFIWI